MSEGKFEPAAAWQKDAWRRLDLAEIFYTVRHRHVTAYLEFEVYEVAGIDQSGALLYKKTSNEFTESIDEAVEVHRGSVKFDGTLSFHPSDGELYLGGRGEAERFTKLLDALFDLALAAMPEHAEYLRKDQP